MKERDTKFVDAWCRKYNFEMYSTEKLALTDLIQTTPKFAEALKFDVSPRFYQEVKQRLTSEGMGGKVESHQKTQMYGPSGKAKSWAMLLLDYFEMQLMGKENEFSVEKHVFFDKSMEQNGLSKIVLEYTGMDIDEFLKKEKVVRIQVALGLDEEHKPGGKGTNIEKNIQESLEKTMRQAQICFTYCSPKIETHVVDSMLRFFAMNFRTHESIAFLMNPETLNPLGVVRFGLPPDKILVAYELEKQKYLAKAGRGEFGGGREELRKQICDDILDGNYDIKAVRNKLGIGTIDECENSRQELMLIEKVCAGRTSVDEHKIILELIIIQRPEFNFKHKSKKEKDEDGDE